MLSMMPDLLGQANQRQTTRRGWRCGGPRPGWQLNQAHDLCQTISRVCCTPRFGGALFLHSARPVRPLHGWRPPALGHRLREDAGQSVDASRKEYTHRRDHCATPAMLPGYFADDGQPAAPPFATVHHCERLLENVPSGMRNRLGTMLKVHPWVQGSVG